MSKKFDFLKLSRSLINKEPVRKLNKKIDVTNYSVSFLKKNTNCSKCIKLLNISEVGHRATSKEYSSNDENWTYNIGMNGNINYITNMGTSMTH